MYKIGDRVEIDDIRYILTIDLVNSYYLENISSLKNDTFFTSNGLNQGDFFRDNGIFEFGDGGFHELKSLEDLNIIIEAMKNFSILKKVKKSKSKIKIVNELIFI